MKRKKEEIQVNIDLVPFKIFQFEKIEGIRSKNAYQKERFISPIFGRNVKDVVTVPFTVKNTGDTTKRFDAFRTKPKLSEAQAKAKHGSKYYEFTNIISHKTRNEYFGTSDYEPIKEEAIKEKPKHKSLRPITTGSKFNQETKFNEGHQSSKPMIKQKTVYVDEPIIEHASYIDEPVVETYKRKPQTQPKIVSSGFGAFESDQTSSINQPDVKPTLHEDTTFYRLPKYDIFMKKARNLNEKPQWLLDQIDVINSTLSQFGIEGYVSGSKKGPTVTRYEIALEPGVNVKRVSGIQDNLMMSLSTKSIRIEAPIPGKPYVGIEVQNVEPEIVAFGNVVDTKAFKESYDQPLKVALGEDIDGENIYVDIAKMPHGLIAGATNSGKSVCVNTILISLLLKNTPDELKMILIDPKMVELTPYNDLPHLITPVITDAKVAAQALGWAVEEMEKRYQTFAKGRSKDIRSFNDNVKRGIITYDKMPYIVIIIDELADLMMVASHDVEDAIQRLTQKARAAGIHLLVATQRPTTDVVKGTIKSNIPTRIAFKVSSFVDSTTILDGAGAETLLGKGDMLLKEGDRAHRLQGAFISDDEIYKVTDFIRNQQKPNYVFEHEALKHQIRQKDIIQDDLFEDVAFFVVESQNASINSIQKEFGIGFNRAQKLVELLEQFGVVSTGQGTKAREVLVTQTQLSRLLGQEEA